MMNDHLLVLHKTQTSTTAEGFKQYLSNVIRFNFC